MRTSIVAVCATLLSMVSMALVTPASAQGMRGFISPAPILTRAVAFDVSRPVSSLPIATNLPFARGEREIRREIVPFTRPNSTFDDPVVQQFFGRTATDAPILTFEGVRNANNPFLVAPPDPNGAVGKTNYVEMTNLVFAVYNKAGTKLAGPTRVATLWAGFAISDCNSDSGDPVVLYDRSSDRFILTQFTTAGPTFYDCVAVSKTNNPAGAYFRYAFSAGQVFPDYPKYGNWSDSYLLTTRDFPNAGGYGISVYALEKAKMVAGNPAARMFHFFLNSATIPIAEIGDGLLPADVDGPTQPAAGAPAPVIGTMNTKGPYGAPFDALNIYTLTVNWATPKATLSDETMLHTAAFNSTFPCPGTGRDCIPQPGTSQKIDFLVRQRPLFRLAWRKFPTFESLVTNQSVQSRPNIAGVRWYEIRRVGTTFSIFQQGTYSPNDTVDRWMGSIAEDKHGDMGLGFAVSNGTTVFPGIRYTGRKVTDPLGMMTLAEGVIKAGSGSQTGIERWGDYSSMNIDPVDDCTFWYVHEYYQVTSSFGWQTRIGSFKIPGC